MATAPARLETTAGVGKGALCIWYIQTRQSITQVASESNHIHLLFTRAPVFQPAHVQPSCVHM